MIFKFGNGHRVVADQLFLRLRTSIFLIFDSLRKINSTVLPQFSKYKLSKMHILSPRWLVPGLRYQWNGVENLRHFAKILSKFSRDCDNFQAPFYTRTSLNYIKICFSPTNCGNVSFKIMHIVVKIWDWANSILQFKIKLERLWNKRALEFVSKQRLSFSVDSQFSQSGCAIFRVFF